MAKKPTRPTPRSRTVRKSKKNVTSWYSSRRAITILVFVIVFGGLGVYLLIRSMASTGLAFTYQNFVVGNSAGATVITETGANSKRNSRVVQLTPGATTKAMFQAPTQTISSGIYKVCLNSLVPSGTAQGNITITAVQASAMTTSTKAYSRSASSNYSLSPCVTGLEVKTTTAMQAIITNTGSGNLRIGSVVFSRTGDVVNNTKPSPYNTDGKLSGNWTLKFQDEFNGSSLDTSAWSTGWLASGITKPVQNQELACYAPDHVAVSGGALQLMATVESHSCGGVSRPYTSGMINSSGKKEFTYGYFEARLWLDESGGKIANWPAWWTDGHNWPTTGEMDVMEGLSGNAKANWHGPIDGGAGHTFGSGGVMTGWHTFAALWEPGKVTAFYDGRQVGSYSSSSNITSAPQFLILGNQIGPENRYGGPVKVPSTIQVDYVRVWQK